MKYRYILLLALAVHWGSASLRAEVFQTISVNVLPREMVEVERKSVPVTELIPEIKASISGDRRVTAKLYVPLGIKRTELERIMALCRKAGVSSFTVIKKS